MGDMIIFWTNLNKSHEFDIDQAIKKAKEDAEIKSDIKGFIDDTIEKIKVTNTCFERIRDMLKLGIIKEDVEKEERSSAQETRSQTLQRYERIIKENKEALGSFKKLLSQI